MLNIDDKVKLNGCPFDERWPEEMLLYKFLSTQVMRVTKTMIPEGTSYQWITTDMMPDWIDAVWFDKVEK